MYEVRIHRTGGYQEADIQKSFSAKTTEFYQVATLSLGDFDPYDWFWIINQRTNRIVLHDYVNALCAQCFHPVEDDYYMVTDALWKLVGVGDKQLCLRCLTDRVVKRCNRPLLAEDFTEVPVNFTCPGVRSRRKYHKHRTY
jgi:hypothetical protein